jgi:hypothetical protein
MGTKRVGLARTQALIENLKREINLGSSTLSFARLPCTAKTADFTAAAGNCYLITKLDGCAVTLPAPTVGDQIKLIFGAVTSNNHTITCDATSTLFKGWALLEDTADGTATEHTVFAPDESNDDAMTLNGTTTGISGIVTLTATATNRWFVEARLTASGTVATPFA